MRNLRNRDGFTLIELMIVVVIIGILAAIAIPKFANVSKSAKQSEAEPTLKQIATLQQSYFQKFDTYQSDITKLTGFEDPKATYFTFSVKTGTATAMCAETALTQKGTDAGLEVMHINLTVPAAATDAKPVSGAC